MVLICFWSHKLPKWCSFWGHKLPKWLKDSLWDLSLKVCFCNVDISTMFTFPHYVCFHNVDISTICLLPQCGVYHDMFSPTVWTFPLPQSVYLFNLRCDVSTNVSKIFGKYCLHRISCLGVLCLILGTYILVVGDAGLSVSESSPFPSRFLPSLYLSASALLIVGTRLPDT